MPVVEAACPETGNAEGTDSPVDNKITDAELLSSTSTESLLAVHKGVEHQLV